VADPHLGIQAKALRAGTALLHGPRLLAGDGLQAQYFLARLGPKGDPVGADCIIIHVELGERVEPLIWKIRSMNMKVGVAVNPPTAISNAMPFLRQIDQLLIMTVNPGFGGQPFISEILPKIQQALSWRAEMGLNYHIEVDGGINFSTAVECAKAGADTFVSGTALLWPAPAQKIRRQNARPRFSKRHDPVRAVSAFQRRPVTLQRVFRP
jgi:hypothetical protein